MLSRCGRLWRGDSCSVTSRSRRARFGSLPQLTALSRQPGAVPLAALRQRLTPRFALAPAFRRVRSVPFRQWGDRATSSSCEKRYKTHPPSSGFAPSCLWPGLGQSAPHFPTFSTCCFLSERVGKKEKREPAAWLLRRPEKLVKCTPGRWYLARSVAGYSPSTAETMSIVQVAGASCRR